MEPLRHNHRKKVGFHQRLHSITILLCCQEAMTVFLLHLQNSLTLFPFGEGLPRFFIEIILLSIRPHSQKSTPEIKNAHADSVRRSTIPSAAKTAHAGIILPHMSGFLAVVDFLALDFLRHRGKRPCRALLGIQFFAGFLVELGAGDELGHA